MSPTVQGSRHRPRQQIALRPGVHSALRAYADKHRQPVRWAMHDILLRALVLAGDLTQEQADELWNDLTGGGKRQDD